MVHSKTAKGLAHQCLFIAEEAKAARASKGLRVSVSRVKPQHSVRSCQMCKTIVKLFTRSGDNDPALIIEFVKVGVVTESIRETVTKLSFLCEQFQPKLLSCCTIRALAWLMLVIALQLSWMLEI